MRDEAEAIADCEIPASGVSTKVCDQDFIRGKPAVRVELTSGWRSWLLTVGQAVSPASHKRKTSLSGGRRQILFIGVPGPTSAAQLICLSAVMHEAAFGPNTSKEAHFQHLRDAFLRCCESQDLQSSTQLRSVRRGETSLAFKFAIDNCNQIRIEEDRARIRQPRFRNSHKRPLQLPRRIGLDNCFEYFLEGQVPIFNPDPPAGTLGAIAERYCTQLGMSVEQIEQARVESRFHDNSIALVLPPCGRDAYLRDRVNGHRADPQLANFMNAALNPDGPSRLQLLSSRGDSLLKEMDAATELSKAPPRLVIVEGIEAMVRFSNVLAGDSSRWTCNGPFRGDIVCIADTCEPNEQLEALGSLIHERESYFETCELPAELRAVPSGFSARLMVERQSS